MEENRTIRMFVSLSLSALRLFTLATQVLQLRSFHCQKFAFYDEDEPLYD
jgi:hypothetical protein